MPQTYYLDTCIWRDHYENRFSKNGYPMGDYASKLFMKIIENQDIILFSDLIIAELHNDYSIQNISDMFNLLYSLKILKKVQIHESDMLDAKVLSKSHNIPLKDMIHAILARKNKAFLITQDKHFDNLKNYVEVLRPQNII